MSLLLECRNARRIAAEECQRKGFFGIGGGGLSAMRVGKLKKPV